MDTKAKMCDLHVHSCYSDGTAAPTELIALAEEAGASALALTDHNTVNGLPEFVAAAENSFVIAVPGVEFSAGYGLDDAEIHILGLFLTENCWPEVTRYLEKRNIAKERSNWECVERLARAGYAVNYDEITAGRENVSINRVHIAEALLQKGYVGSVKEAFKTLLKPAHGYYVEPAKLPVLDVIAKIRQWGGVAVWAHPLLNLKGDTVERFLSEAVSAGMQGMETRYSLFGREEETLLDELAKRHGLLTSGGSDFHGANKPDIAIGTGKGKLHVPYEYFEKLRALAR